MKKIFFISLLFICSFAHAQFGGVLEQQSRNPSDYSRSDAMTQGRVIEAVVEQVRTVTLQSGEGCRASGALVGGMIGALLGRKETSYQGQALVGMLGALGGSQVGGSICKDNGLELIVKLDTGGLLVVPQQVDPTQSFVKGQRVGLVQINGKSRIIAI
ncbi:MAG: hypothetical protein QM533_05030 [Cytophagales bacterium]|nr:hypothetical protein [Cytophagales bacterium]